MAVARQPNTLIPTDAAYIAGLIDGEGTITFYCWRERSGLSL